MSERSRLPRRRMCESIKFSHGDQKYHATIGRYDDGRIGEVFINSAKVGSAVDINMKDAAIAVSLALQHGCDMAALRKAFLRNAEGAPEGPLAALFDMLEASEVVA